MSRLVHLHEIEVHEIAAIARERSALVLGAEWAEAGADVREEERHARAELLTDRIVERIAAFSQRARIELLALTWVGQGESHDDWALALGHAELNDRGIL